MKKFKKYLSVILCLVITIGCFAAIPASALTYPAMAEISSSSGVASIYSLPGTTGHETSENKNQSQFLCQLSNGTQIKVLGVEKDGDGDPWYKINYGENLENSGYAFVNRVRVNYEYAFDEDFEENLKNFPESYHNALRTLHAKYPNWQFVANDLDITFNDAVEAQYGVDDVTQTRKWVEFTYRADERGCDLWRDERAYNSITDKWITLESRWTYASRVAIEYFMDPRNSLNEDMIFAFMQQSYQEDANMQSNLSSVIKGTFLENGYDKDDDGTIEKDAYIQDLINAAKESGVSPYVLAATIIVEQGVGGTSNLISGTYSGYEGYYNFFNFNAAGSTVQAITENGLAYAKQNGWNSREAAITGGAKAYADGYISVGQDTYYYKDFNVLKEYWSHQYASALYDAWTNASYLKKGCVTNTDTTLTFLIPVYKDMPERPCIIPSAIIETDTGYYMWRLEGSTLIISGEGDMSAESPWLDCDVEITKVIIEDGITSIGSFSFSNCESLTDVSIPDSVKKIGENAFAYCSSLKNINISNSVTSIGERAFYYCTGFTDLTIPDSVTTIGEYAFYGCWNLENITLSKNLKTISAHTFELCEKLKSVVMPVSVKTVSYKAFFNCSELTDIWYAGSKSDKEKITIVSSSAGNNYLEYTATWHYNVCDVHTYVSDCDTVCENCDWTRNTEVEHTNTDNNPTVCDVCGAIIDHIHSYDNDCDVDCNTCGQIRTVSGHSYSDSCDSKCNICDHERTVPDHTFTNACDKTCNSCGSVRKITEHTYNDCFKGYSEEPYYSCLINITETGVYSLTPSGSGYTGEFSDHNIVVFDKQDNKVIYNEKLGGWPLVKGQYYDIQFRYNCSDEINGLINWKRITIANTIFPDTNAGDWYNDAVVYSVGSGLISGYGSTGLFGTADNIQRQDFLVILARLDGVDLTKYTNKNCPFPDVAKGSYYEAAVMWGVENGITTGYQNGKFGVGDKITREQLVTFLYRYANYKGLDTSYTTAEKNKVKNSYSDFKNVTGYAVDPIIWGISNGVISGKENGKYIAPGGNALRCEVAQIMYNIYLNDIF